MKNQKYQLTNIIKCVSPNNWERYSCKGKCRAEHPEAYSNYERVSQWKYNTTNRLKKYLACHNLNESASSKRINHFMAYLLAIYFLAYETPETDNGKAIHVISSYPYFIDRHLNHFDKIDRQSRWVKAPITPDNMSIFFCLFLKASDCLKEIGYELTKIQRSEIDYLKSQTNLSFSESFERLVRIFFPEN